MSIPEKLSVLTPRPRNDYGAQPSREQQAVIDRVHEVLRRTRRERRRLLFERKKEAEDNDERFDIDPPQQPPARSTRNIRYTAIGEELLAAMRGCSRLGVALVLIQHAQDRSSYPAALDELVKEATNLYLRNRWVEPDDDKGKDILRSMCRLALLEAAEPKCPQCKGRGHGMRGGACRSCGSTGDMRIFDRDRAYAIGVMPDAYRKTHRRRYQWIQSIVTAYEHSTIDEMYENLYGKKRY